MEVQEEAPFRIPSLASIAIKCLLRHRQWIQDLGWIQIDSLRAVLSHCGPEDLRRIEDGTLAGSSRDISWYTWDLWARIYEQQLGSVRATSTELKPLPTAAPPDYEDPTKGQGLPTADWRSMLSRDMAADKARAASISNKLRSKYDEALSEKANKSVAVCDIAPAKKRKRAVAGLSGGGGSRGLAAPPGMDSKKVKMFQDLGFIRAPPKSSSGAKSYSSGPSGVKKQVTKTVVVHKAGSGAAAAAVATRPAAAAAKPVGTGQPGRLAAGSQSAPGPARQGLVAAGGSSRAAAGGPGGSSRPAAGVSLTPPRAVGSAGGSLGSSHHSSTTGSPLVARGTSGLTASATSSPAAARPARPQGSPLPASILAGLGGGGGGGARPPPRSISPAPDTLRQSVGASSRLSGAPPAGGGSAGARSGVQGVQGPGTRPGSAPSIRQAQAVRR